MFRSASRYIVALSCLLCVFASAQTTETTIDGLSLDAVLMRLQIRRWEYLRNVPDFFADEMVSSDMRGAGIPSIHTLSDSIFRLRRSTAPGIFPPQLVETRTLRSSNGSAVPPGSPLAGPAILINAFSNGLTTIALDQKPCYDFRISPHHDVHHTRVFAINYRLKPGADTTGVCVPWQDVSGQAIVDAATFTILQFNMRVPRYSVAPGILGIWQWSIDFAPVVFDGRTFSMPRHTASYSESLDGRYFWTFAATYRNYHKTGVRSRIITNLGDDDTGVPTQPDAAQKPLAQSPQRQ